MNQPEEEKDLRDDLQSQVEEDKQNRKEESQRLLQDIGKNREISDRLEEGINLTEWIKRASGSGYRIGRDEWFEVIKEVVFRFQNRISCRLQPFRVWLVV